LCGIEGNVIINNNRDIFEFYDEQLGHAHDTMEGHLI